jgi:hypothetical protein
VRASGKDLGTLLEIAREYLRRLPWRCNSGAVVVAAAVAAAAADVGFVVVFAANRKNTAFSDNDLPLVILEKARRARIFAMVCPVVVAFIFRSRLGRGRICITE